MPMLGAHMSIAGGLHKAVEAASALGMDTVQIFTHSPSQWVVPPLAVPGTGRLRSAESAASDVAGRQTRPITDSEAASFRRALAESGLRQPLVHASYLINLAAPDPDLRERSVVALAIELQRAEQLGISFVVVHPGAHTTSTERQGLRQIIRSLDRVDRLTRGLRARCLLENTAGQGTTLGWRFEHLATILNGVRAPERLGCCLDTCHAYAAGYSLAPAAAYRQTTAQLLEAVGAGRLQAIHLNDSQRERGARVDRHAHIGQGAMGVEPFQRILRDPRFRDVPMYLETPKGTDPATGDEWDAINLRLLRSLAVAR